MKPMIILPATYQCPYCGHKSNTCFPPGTRFDGGSAGYRTYKCPKCNQDMEE